MESQPLAHFAVPSEPTLQMELPLQQEFVGLVGLVNRDDLDILAEPSLTGPTANTATLAELGNKDIIFNSLLFFSETEEDSMSLEHYIMSFK